MATLRTHMEKRAMIGGIVGAVRTGNLSDSEVQELRERYGLPEDANLMARNIGRGLTGSIAGQAVAPFTAAGGVLAGALLADTLKMRGLGGVALAGAGGLAGLFAPSYLAIKGMTNKYSKAALGEEE